MNKKASLVFLFLLINTSLLSMEIESVLYPMKTYPFSHEKFLQFQKLITEALMNANQSEVAATVLSIKNYLEPKGYVESQLFEKQWDDVVNTVCNYFLKDLEMSNSNQFGALKHSLKWLLFKKDNFDTPLYILSELHLKKIFEVVPDKKAAYQIIEFLEPFQKNKISITKYRWNSWIKYFSEKKWINSLPLRVLIQDIIVEQE